MNTQAAQDFHAALLAMQDIAADTDTVVLAEERTAQLARQVFAFLDLTTSTADTARDEPDKLAA